MTADVIHNPETDWCACEPEWRRALRLPSPR